MSEEKKYEKVFDLVFEQSIPDEAEIDRMSPEQVEEYLADSGLNMAEFRKRAAAKKVEFAGKFALMRARQKRLEHQGRARPDVDVPETREGIVQKLIEHFRNRNLAQIYGRNFSTADYEELRQLYIDTVAEDQGKYGDDAKGQHDQGGKPGE